MNFRYIFTKTPCIRSHIQRIHIRVIQCSKLGVQMQQTISRRLQNPFQHSQIQMPIHQNIMQTPVLVVLGHHPKLCVTEISARHVTSDKPQQVFMPQIHRVIKSGFMKCRVLG